MSTPAPSTRQLLDSAKSHHRAGRLQEAATDYRQVLAAQPDDVEALAGLGSLALQVNRPDNAAGLLSRAVQLRPDLVPLRYQLAMALRALKQWPAALEQVRQVAAMLPNSADAACDVATTLGAMGREDEALEQYARALALDPGHAMANYNLGVSLQARSRFAEGAEALRRAVARDPKFALAHNNLGSVQRDLGEPQQAIESYRRAIELSPGDPRYRNNIALAFQDLLRMDEAIESFDTALRLRPDYVKARAFRSMALLLTGDYAWGFADYEARREIEGHFADQSVGRPKWDGSDVAGKTILLHNEQGLGDTIQFVRYAPMVAARGARVIVQCQPPLKTLLEASLLPRGVWKVVAEGEPVGEFDLYCPLPGLPHVFRTTVESIPADVPYLAAPQDRVDAWRQRAGAEPAFKVGIAWAGTAGNRNDRRRSVPLAGFEPLARTPGVRLYSLQKGDAAVQLSNQPRGMDVQDWGGHFGDFADTAGAMMNLDLIVSVDTSVVHLAGALGRSVWTLIPFSPDWRWMLNRSDSPWYPTMRLFRQPTVGDWSAVFEEVAEALRAEIRG
jgi:tetratricopeptide (TPR) repeat protein